MFGEFDELVYHVVNSGWQGTERAPGNVVQSRGTRSANRKGTLIRSLKQQPARSDPSGGELRVS